MNRRRFLTTSGTAALALAMGGCATRRPPPGAAGRQPVILHPVDVAWDRIIRTTVGLRPYRESGFRLEAERLDEKTVIHNFGHGGAGMSLSWGTARLAADLAVAHSTRRAAVIGCGIVGLTTARVLQRRGFAVTIYARELPPETTSNMSWAAFTPLSWLVARRTPQWEAQFRTAVDVAYREHQLLVGRGYGVSWIYNYAPVESPGPGSGLAGDDPLVPPALTGSVLLQPGEHPFPSRFARRTVAMRFEPSIYLDALLRDVLAFGGGVTVRAFDSPRDLTTLEEELIVNCSGLGAKSLFGDGELTPVKGQLTILLPQPEVDYSLGSMMPRTDGIALGHTSQPGDWSLEVDHEAQVRIVERAMRTFASLHSTSPSASTPRSLIRAVPDQGPPPIESSFVLRS